MARQSDNWFAGFYCSRGILGVLKYLRRLGVILAVANCLAGCTESEGANSKESNLQVVATTPILADIAKNIGGSDVQVTTLIPTGKDPHTFEPSLRTLRTAAYADVALSNGLLLEPQGLINAMKETAKVPVTEVAEEAATRGARLEPLVENVTLDALWLGLRIRNASQDQSSVSLSLRDVHGPGSVTAYVVSTFGTPEVIFNSANGLSEREDTAILPANAHTHVSWAFSAPGIYTLDFGISKSAVTSITVAVGVNPPANMQTIDNGHVDITADMKENSIELEDQGKHFSTSTTALVVPSSMLQEIPDSAAYRFLGRPGSEIFLLPQAVLGKHIHGEVDPHLWHNARNMIAYAEVISEHFTLADPTHGIEYRARAQAYETELLQADEYLRHRIEMIPVQRRHLVTPHHGYAYLKQGYGIDIAGFVTPSPAVEPSPREVMALRRTLENLKIPAVFVSPSQEAGADILRNAANDMGIQVCPLYADTLDSAVSTYLDMMKFNADSLYRCLAS